MANKIEMTASAPRWDPHSERFEEREQDFIPNFSHIDHEENKPYRMLASISRMPTIMEWEVYEALDGKRERDAKATATGARKGRIGAKQLAEAWGISLDMAEKTVDATTQRGVRDFTNVTGTKRLRSMDKQFRYRQLDCTMYADTVEGPCQSLNGNKHATVFTTEFG
jgi:hypothetical protein